MESRVTYLCACGSGLEFAQCHGDPGNAFAREQALREAEVVAWMFPAVRVSESDLEAFIAETARVYPNDDPPESVIKEGLADISTAERRRVVNLWAEPYADRWASMTHAAGDVEAAEEALLIGALRAAVAERQTTPTELVRPLDGGGLRRSPFAALAVVLPPALVWSIDEARAAKVAGSQRRERARMDAVEGVAYALMTFAHIRRTTALAARLASELPFEVLPRASKTLSDACTDVERSLDAARTATAALLVAYVEQLR
jgi:hypothetical protein